MIATSARHSSAKSKSEADEQVLHSLKTCWRRKQGYSTIGNAFWKVWNSHVSTPISHSHQKWETGRYSLTSPRLKKTALRKKWKCINVVLFWRCLSAELPPGIVWGLGNTLTHWPHVLKLSCLLLSPGASHNTGVEQTSHVLPSGTTNFLCSGSLLPVSSFGSV